MIRYSDASAVPVQALSALWEEVFGDDPAVLDRFFTTLFSPERTLVCTEEEKLLAALYMLPVELSVRGELYKAHYIYAAATAPAFRRRGIMGRLLENAAAAGEKRGESYSLLLPANAPLYGYYRKFGYEDFFNIREISLPDLKNAVKYNRKKPDCFTLWPEAHRAFAFWSNRFYGGFSHCGKEGYLLCGEQTAYDAFAEDEETLRLLLLEAAKGETFTARVPACFFEGAGRVLPHGMIRPLGRSGVPAVSSAYLNFTLE